MKLRDRLGIGPARQRRATRAMQTVLVAILVAGALRVSVGVMVNAGMALALTALPALLERDYDIPLDAGLTLWLTTAVFLHAVGGLGVYRSVWWWDHVTHLLSASLVGAAGYTAARAVDVHSDEVSIPPRSMFVFILMFVLAFGVVWEVLEFGIGLVGDRIEGARVLTQYGIHDTMLDLLFDAIGGVVVATWGTVYLGDVVGSVAALMDRRDDRER